MGTVTDPAREMVELCERIGYSSQAAGQDHLARLFKVEPWSIEFHRIIASIIERIGSLKSIIEALDMDDDIRAQILSHVGALQSGFNGQSLLSRWDQKGGKYLSATHLATLKAVSPQVRVSVSYPKLSPEEVQEVLELTESLMVWLAEHQLQEQDFIRQAILDGLTHFHFRLTYFDWLGWGYAVEALREVIGAYLALERGVSRDAVPPDAKAVLKKVWAYLGRTSAKVGVVREAADNADFILKLYGACQLAIAGKDALAGLLPSS